MLDTIARLASSAARCPIVGADDSKSGDTSDNKVVFSELDGFVRGLQLHNESHEPKCDDVFMEEDEVPKALKEKKEAIGGWVEVLDSANDEQPKREYKEDIAADNIFHDAPVGKGLSGALKLLKERGSLNEEIECGGRSMDKKKSKRACLDDEGPLLARRDKHGRVLTQKEAFRLDGHIFHGIGPGKKKEAKRMKKYEDERKRKQRTSSDKLPQSMERMVQIQAQLKTPYLCVSGHV